MVQRAPVFCAPATELHPLKLDITDFYHQIDRESSLSFLAAPQ